MKLFLRKPVLLAVCLWLAAPDPRPLQAQDEAARRSQLEVLRRMVPEEPDAEKAIESLTFIALGGEHPPDSPIQGTRQGLVASFHCTAGEPRPLTGLDVTGVLPLECDAESRPGQPEGVIRLIGAVSRGAFPVALFERLEYRASATTLRLRLRLLAPFFRPPAGVTAEALFDSLLRTVERIRALPSDDLEPVLREVLRLGDGPMTSVELEGGWRLVGDSYRYAESPSWWATTSGPGTSGGFRRNTLQQDSKVTLSISDVKRRSGGACAAVEIDGKWQRSTRSSAAAPEATSNVASDRPFLLGAEPCPFDRDPADRQIVLPPLSGSGDIKLRMREVDLVDIIRALAELTGQGFVVDQNVVGRATLDFSGVTLEGALSALERAASLSVSRPSRIRRVSLGSSAHDWAPPRARKWPSSSQPGQRISFDFKRQPLQELLGIFSDITGLPVESPAGLTERVSASLTEEPWPLVYESILSAVGLRMELSDSNTLRVRRGREPVSRLGTGGGAFHRIEPDVQDARFVGVAERYGKWRAAFYFPTAKGLSLVEAGFRFRNGVLKSVAADHVTIQWESTNPLEPDGPLLRLPLPSAAASGLVTPASSNASDGASPASLLYERAASGELGVPVDARSRLLFHWTLVQYFLELGGEEETARRAVRDGVAAAAALDLSDPTLARQAVLIAVQARSLQAPLDELSPRLGTLGSVLDRPETIWLLRLLAEVVESSARRSEAAGLWDRVVRSLEAEYARDPRANGVEYAQALDAAGRLRADAGDWRTALERYATAVTARVAALGAGHADVLESRLFKDALEWNDRGARAAAIERLRGRLATQADPAAAAWYPKLWEAEWQHVVDAASLTKLRRSVTADLGRSSAQAMLRPDVRQAAEMYLLPRFTWMRVKSFRLNGGRWEARIAEQPGESGETSPVPGLERNLRQGDRLAEGVVKHVSPLGLFVEAELADWLDSERRKVWLRFLPPQPVPAVTIGRDTTRITGPLRPDGTPDYAAWLNQTHGAGVTPENNAAAPMQEAMAALVEGPQTFWEGLKFRGEDQSESAIGRVRSSPWVDADCPECVARLERNGATLARIVEAARRPRLFLPVPSGARLPFAVPSLLSHRRSANALAGRGMLHLGRGDLQKARQDALAIQRLALLVGQGHLLIDNLIAIAIRGIGIALWPRIAHAPGADPSLVRGLLEDLVGLPQMRSTAEVIDQGERFVKLDSMLAQRQLIAERGPAGALVASGWRTLFDLDTALPEKLGLEFLLSAVDRDWSEELRLANREADLIVAMLAAPTGPERRLARAGLEAESKRLQDVRDLVDFELDHRMRGEDMKALDLARALDEIGRTADGRRRLAALMTERRSLARAGIAWNEAEAQFRLALFSVALAVQKLEAGGFPERLDALAGERLPDRLADSTPLPGYTLSYVAEIGAAGSTYALIAVPEELGQTGTRAFCVDSTGVLRVTNDGKPPKVVSGVCDPSQPLLR